MSFNNKLNKICQSQITHYIGIRYISFGLQFVNSMFIAKYLGVFYFGIYCFLFLVNQYLSYPGMIPALSLNVLLSTKKRDTLYSKKIFFNSLSINVSSNLFLAFLGLILLFFYPNLFSKYLFHKYAVYILIIFFLASVNILFINLYRAYGLLWKINFNQFIVPVINFSVLFFAKGEHLLILLLLSNILGNLISLIVFCINTPIPIYFNYNQKSLKELYIRGFNLLLYNISFYLTLLASRTIVSIYYSTTDLGYYTLAVNLSSSIFMIVSSFSFILYPKLLNKFNEKSLFETEILIQKLRSVYITSCYLITYMGFLAIPILTFILPQYVEAISSFKILILAQLILNNNFGYGIILVSLKKERLMTKNAIISLIIIVIISLVISLMHAKFYFITLADFLGFLFYCLLVTKDAYAELGKKISYIELIKELFPVSNLIPILILGMSIVLGDNYFTPVLSLVIFILMNKSRILDAYQKGLSLLTNKNSLTY